MQFQCTPTIVLTAAVYLHAPDSLRSLLCASVTFYSQYNALNVCLS